MRLKFLGTGSAFNTELGNNSAYWINYDNLHLIDCGETIFQEIIKRNLLQDIKSVVVYISHTNSDHIGSLSTLIYYCFFVKRISISVVSPDDTIKTILKLMGNKETEYKFIKINNILSFGEFGYVNFIKTEHIEGINCYGLEIKIDNDFIYYSGDTKELIDYSKTSYTAIYQDVSNYKGGVHTYVDDFIELNKNSNKNIYGMHFDCKETILKCVANGIKIVGKDE